MDPGGVASDPASVHNPGAASSEAAPSSSEHIMSAIASIRGRSTPVLRELLVLATLCLSLLGGQAVAQDDIEAVEVSVDTNTALRLDRVDHDTAAIVIDGKLDEPMWRRVRVHNNLRVVQPDTLAVPGHESRIRLFYTDRGVYVSFDMDQPAATLIQRYTPRDGRDESRDFVSFTLDSSGGGRYGYWMALALGDSQADGTVLPERQFQQDWDGAWYGATALTETGWSAEFFVPWSQMAMPKESLVRRMGFYGSRNVGYLNERYAWPALPDSLPRFMSALQPVELEGINPRQQWSLFPYLSTTVDNVDSETTWRAGTDVFWRPSSNFQLTATLNPDFGAAEADRVDVNLTANETFFPERRLFFLEGREVFDATPRATAEGRDIFTLLNTRRIGSRPRRPDFPDGVSLPARQAQRLPDLLGAAKATGQIGSFRYGMLAATEDDTNLRADDGNRYVALGRDFGAMRVIYEDSENAAYRGLGFLTTAVLHPESDAVVHSSDLHYLSTNGRFRFDGQAIYAQDDDVGNDVGGFSDFTYTPRQGRRHLLQLAYFGENFQVNDFGFNQRNDMRDLRYRYEWIKSGLTRIRNFRLSPFIRYAENVTEGRQVQGAYGVNLEATLNNLHSMEAFLGYFPARFDDQNSFGNGTFAVRDRGRYTLDYRTNEANKLSFNSSVRYQDEDIAGRRIDYGLGLRWQPISNFALELRANYQDRKGWLLQQEGRDFTMFNSERWQPEVQLQYFASAYQQLQLSLQWIGIRAEEDRFYRLPVDSVDLDRIPKPTVDDDSFSISQVNLQIRYRWQIAPLSDLFVVYTRGDRTRRELIEFDELFSNSWNEPLGDVFLVKLRYRMGS